MDTNGFSWHLLDVLIIAWYLLNLLSQSWALSGSEALWYAQRIGLFLTVYFVFRWSFLQTQTPFIQHLPKIIRILSLFSICWIGAQLVQGMAKHGLDNEQLYDQIKGAFGNKSLAADFLFLLLSINIWANGATTPTQYPGARFFRVGIIVLLGILILLLQVRTVYLATAAFLIIYFLMRGWFEADFRKILWRRILPLGIAGLLLFWGFYTLKGGESSLLERLNPFTYDQSLSANERRFVWYKTDLLNADHPWLGVGAGNWKIWFPANNIQGGYRLQEQNIVFTRVHNDYLEARAETGILGAVLFIGIFLTAGAYGLRALRTNPRTASVLLAALTGYCVLQFFSFPRERVEHQMLLALVLAALATPGAWFVQGIRGLPSIPFLFRFLMLITGLNIIIGWMRMDGEIHNVRMLEAQSKKQYQKVIEEADAAQNAMYAYDDVVLPLAYHMGTANYRLKRYPEAVAAFEKALPLAPWNFSLLNDYASALSASGKTRESIAWYLKALAINPRLDEAKLNLAYEHLESGDYQTALEWLAKVDTIANPSNAYDRQKNAYTLQQIRVLKDEIIARMK